MSYLSLRNHKWIVISLVSAGISGCSSESTLSETTIRKALEQDVSLRPCAILQASTIKDGDPEKATVPGSAFPIQINEYSSYQGYVAWDTKDGPLKELANISVLVSETGAPGKFNQAVRRVVTYKVAPGAESVFETKVTKGSDGSEHYHPMVCFGRGVIESVDNFTIPAEQGPQMTSVSFTWKAEAKTDMERRVLESQNFRGIKPKIYGTENAVLSLTNNGWQNIQADN